MKDQAQNSQYQGAPEAEMHATEIAKSPASAALVTTIFNVLVGAAQRPLHAFE